MTRDDINGEEESSDWGRFTDPRLTSTLIVLCVAGLVARAIWPEPLTTGLTGFLFGLLFLLAAFEAIMEFVAAFTWESAARYVRAGLLAFVTVLFFVL